MTHPDYTPDYRTKGRSLQDRFWEKVHKTDGCWEWIAARTPFGYGKLLREHRNNKATYIYAHRLSYEFAYGKPPDDLLVLHSCDNPCCVRPDHLFLGTDGDNTKDKKAKDRNHRGERHGNARLTADMVLDIRRRAAAGEGFAAIARSIGVNEGTIRAVVHRKSWTHI